MSRRIPASSGESAKKGIAVEKSTVSEKDEKVEMSMCREDREGEGSQMPFGTNNLVFVKEQIHTVVRVKE